MTALYLFCAAVGIPLLLWFSFAGDSGGGDGFGNAEADGPLAFLSLSTMSFVLGFFGLTGLLLEIVGTAGLVTLLVAIITAVAAGAFNSAAFRWLRRNSNSSEVMDHELEGMIANVALPISGEHALKFVVHDFAGVGVSSKPTEDRAVERAGGDGGDDRHEQGDDTGGADGL